MKKIVGLVRRRPDMSRAAFRAYWLDVHTRLEKDLLDAGAISRIVINFCEEELLGSAPFDGMVELYFEDQDHLRRLWESGADKVMQEDEKNFCDTQWRVFFACEEIDVATIGLA